MPKAERLNDELQIPVRQFDRSCEIFKLTVLFTRQSLISLALSCSSPTIAPPLPLPSLRRSVTTVAISKFVSTVLSLPSPEASSKRNAKAIYLLLLYPSLNSCIYPHFIKSIKPHPENFRDGTSANLKQKHC